MKSNPLRPHTPDDDPEPGTPGTAEDLCPECAGTGKLVDKEAVTSTKLRLVKRQSLERSAQSNVTTMQSLLRMMSINLQHAEDHGVLLLGQKTALERVASFLIEMESRAAAAGVLTLPMSRLDIADYLGLPLETVSRALARLKRRGVISFMGTQRDIVVVQFEGLAQIDSC